MICTFLDCDSRSRVPRYRLAPLDCFRAPLSPASFLLATRSSYPRLAPFFDPHRLLPATASVNHLICFLRIFGLKGLSILLVLLVLIQFCPIADTMLTVSALPGDLLVKKCSLAAWSKKKPHRSTTLSFEKRHPFLRVDHPIGTVQRSTIPTAIFTRFSCCETHSTICPRSTLHGSHYAGDRQKTGMKPPILA